ncbi:hypothetical protein SEA_KABOCHA_2 [Gordonia phage Kabocha]|nr:hypothetical protein PBI_GRAY_2 [Gordonia phage Gray]WAA19789.1 hypothetical protein SEA_KABOCHA_2 [Gordonia phage Kabocha]WAA19980.1 hypothetical protein SEA_HANEM_2 [Gordonia phage Hanem]WNM67023.1 hypothetical protein SEA_SCHOMBER_2 [Gordonia Phage Schomber]
MFGMHEAITRIKGQISGIKDRLELLEKSDAEQRTFSRAVHSDLDSLRTSISSLADHNERQLDKFHTAFNDSLQHIRDAINENVGKQYPQDMRRMCLELASRMDDMESISDVVSRAAYLEHLILNGFDTPAPDEDEITDEDDPEDRYLETKEANGIGYLQLETEEGEDDADSRRVLDSVGRAITEDMTHHQCPNKSYQPAEGGQYVARCVLPRGHAGECQPGEPAYEELPKGSQHAYVEDFGLCAICGRSEIAPLHYGMERLADPDTLVLDSVNDGKDGNSGPIIGWKFRHRPSGMTTELLNDYHGPQADAAKAVLRDRVIQWKGLNEVIAEGMANLNKDDQ